MLQSIGDFLQGIWDFLSLIIDFIIGLVKDIAYFVQLIQRLPYTIALAFSWIPPIISIAIIGCITLFILLRVIGRD